MVQSLVAIFIESSLGDKRKDTDTGSPLPRITPHRIKLGLDWSHGPFNLGTEVQFVAAQNRISSSYFVR